MKAFNAVAGRKATRGGQALGVWLGLVMALAVPATTSAKPRPITVDAGKSVGTFRPLQGTAGIPGPVPHFGMDTMPDVTPVWREAHVTLVRSHDWTARLDTVNNPESLFPDWAADPDDPASYNFAAADAWVQQVRATGAQVLFTFAPAIPKNKLPTNDLPKYERVVEHIVRHYTQGWGDGMTDAVRYWEFSDQPDFGKLHFAGEPEQFYAMYGAVARAVKRVDPALQVGGPALAFPLNANAPYREGFLDAVRSRALPLDFFSWMWFSDTSRDPMDLNRIGQDLRALLDQKGFASTKLLLNSWNAVGIPTTKLDPVDKSAFIGAASIYMQDSVIDNAILFRGDTGVDPHYAFVDPTLIIEKAGQPDPRAGTFILTGRTTSLAERLAVSGGDKRGFAVLAGRDADRKVVRVLIANYAIPASALAKRASDEFQFQVPIGPSRVTMTFTLPSQRTDAAASGDDSYQVTVRDLPWGKGPYTVSRYRVDSGHKGELIATTTGRGGIARLSAPLSAPAVEMIEIRASTGDGQ